MYIYIYMYICMYVYMYIYRYICITHGPLYLVIHMLHNNNPHECLRTRTFDSLVWLSIISLQNNLRYKCIIGGQVATLMEDTIFHWWTIGDIGELYWLAKFNLSRGTCLIFYVLFPIWFKSYINFDKLSLTCGGSQIVFHESQHVCVFVDHIIIFLVFVEVKKMPKVIWRIMFHLRAREFPHLTMWCNFE